MAATIDGPKDAAPGARSSTRLAVDVLVAAALAVVLGAVFLLDSRTPQAPPPAAPPDLVDAPAPPPPEPPPPPPGPLARPADSTPRVVLHTRPDGRFGLVCLTGNPDDPSDDGKQLTFSSDGQTNNTRVMVDGRSPEFGASEGADRRVLALRARRRDDHGLAVPRRAGSPDPAPGSRRRLRAASIPSA